MSAPRAYAVRVQGHDEVVFVGHSPAVARAAVWRQYSEAYPCSFRDFLSISSVRRDHHHEIKPITVDGAPAWQTGPEKGNCVPFIYDNGGVEMWSHNSDVGESP